MAAFKVSRQTFPPLTVVTPHDVTPSSYTRKLTAATLRRLVNQARSTLFDILRHDTPSFSGAFRSTHDAFDLVVKLKAASKAEKSSGNARNFVASFDPVACFMEELTSAFPDLARFHLNLKERTIGVKVLDDSEIDAIVDDIKILGKGIVSDVTLMR